jgi:hypothetical protein
MALSIGEGLERAIPQTFKGQLTALDSCLLLLLPILICYTSSPNLSLFESVQNKNQTGKNSQAESKPRAKACGNNSQTSGEISSNRRNVE